MMMLRLWGRLRSAEAHERTATERSGKLSSRKTAETIRNSWSGIGIMSLWRDDAEVGGGGRGGISFAEEQAVNPSLLGVSV